MVCFMEHEIEISFAYSAHIVFLARGQGLILSLICGVLSFLTS